jgi:3-deoxy-7-phosphoheptulonate synthase
MTRTYDLNVRTFTPLLSPRSLKQALPLTDRALQTVIAGRRDIETILNKKDDRLLMIVGPCSIHDEASALEYAEKLGALKDKVKSTLCIIMRIYFEKPRTTIGWKGWINDPFLDATCNIEQGLRKARKLLIDINQTGLAAATELLEPIIPPYISDLISWAAIGARTTESQTHREMASGLSMPVGFKNSTDGSLFAAINALQAARAPQHFLGIDHQGQSSIVKTTGNPFGHIVLRGGEHPNYDPVSIQKTLEHLKSRGLFPAVMIDCSHDNSGQNHEGQAHVFKSVLEQYLEGNTGIMGMMLESHLNQGNQKCPESL